MPGLGAEAMIFLYAGLSGLTVLAGYDVLRWFRRIIRHHDFLVGVEDILYSVAVSIYLFRQLYVTTYGSIRWYFIAGILLGMLFWKSVKILLKKMLSNLRKSLEKFKKKIYATININELNKIIKYYENNKFIILSFSADSNFQRNQILNYLVSGVILEKVLPFSILLDIQKKYYPFEQKFYNYARKYKLPIILCGQKY